MKAKDGVYTGFLILDEKDILELKHMIKNYKPISPNDMAFLHHKLEKKGKVHLVKFFEMHIMGKGVAQKKHQSTPQAEKKNKTTIENYQTKKYKASDFHFYDDEIRVGKYSLKTGRAFSIPSSILQKIEGEFVVKIRPDKTFYFENHDLTRLLDLVENYCISYLDTMCETWIQDEIDSIQKDVKKRLYLDFKDFALNEKTGKYELKNNAIKYSPLSKQLLKCEFIEYINRRKNIPVKYRNIYKYKFQYAKQIDKFNEEFRLSLTNIIRKYIYYTDKDLEVIKWRGENYCSPSVFVDFVLTDEDSGKGIIEWISADSCLYYQQVEMEFKYAPQGKLYEFYDEAIMKIDDVIESLKVDELYKLLYSNLQSIKCKERIKLVVDEYFQGCFSMFCLDGTTRYGYEVVNPLLDIADNHYCIGHPKIEEYTYKLHSGYIDKIAYFKDPNYMCSQECTGTRYVDCYLLANEEYIALYALDYSKSTYVFKVKKGCVDIAMFLIWSYFSSRIYNKRVWKSIDIERLFSYFGIEWYDNTGLHITKNEEGLYQFILPICFYKEF